MRSKIIAVNAGIVTVIAILTYVLLQTSLKDVVANPVERKKEVAQALRAASAQLALDALRLERWLEHSASNESTRGVLALGTAEARSEAATAEAAMQMVRESRWDIVILDLNLQGEKSFPVADALAEAGIPFMIVSGHNRSILPARHADRPFLAKPCPPRLLLATFRQMIEARENGQRLAGGNQRHP